MHRIIHSLGLGEADGDEGCVQLPKEILTRQRLGGF